MEDAADIPEEVDLPFLCQMLDQAITLVPEHLRLESLAIKYDVNFSNVIREFSQELQRIDVEMLKRKRKPIILFWEEPLPFSNQKRGLKLVNGWEIILILIRKNNEHAAG